MPLKVYWTAKNASSNRLRFGAIWVALTFLCIVFIFQLWLVWLPLYWAAEQLD
jgi:hypothetical protein